MRRSHSTFRKLLAGINVTGTAVYARATCCLASAAFKTTAPQDVTNTATVCSAACRTLIQTTHAGKCTQCYCSHPSSGLCVKQVQALTHLAAIGILARVCHAEDACSCVPEL